MILAHHEWRGWREKHAKDMLEQRLQYVVYGQYMPYIETFGERIHESVEKIAKYKLRYQGARKYLEDRSVVIAPEEAFELPDDAKTGFHKFGSKYRNEIGADEDASDA